MAVCETVTLSDGASLVGDAADQVGCAYFPMGCVLALLASGGDGHELQVGMVGRHGVLMLGPQDLAAMAPARAMVQMGGPVLRVSCTALRRELGGGKALDGLLHRALEQRTLQAVSTAACAHFHPLSQRLCRFLLASAACAGDLRLQMTHETMARMLGVRRSGITEEVAELQRRGLVLCHRGGVDLLALDALGRGACRCLQADHPVQRSERT